MGWWSADIFGGDTPLDCQGHIEKVLGMKYDYSAPIATDMESIREEILTHGFDRKVFQDNIGKIFSNPTKYDAHIYYQVVGALCANMGIKIEDFQKKMVLDAIDHEVCAVLNRDDDCDGWVDERRKVLATLHNAMLTYTSAGHIWNDLDESKAQETRKHRIELAELQRKYLAEEAEKQRILDVIELDNCKNI